LWYDCGVETDTIRFTAVIKSREDEQRRFWGRGYIHTTADGQVTDASGDYIDTPETQAELEEAFYGFVKDYRTGDAGHELFDAATMIEGFIVTAEKKTAGLFPADMDEGIYVGFQADETDAGEILWDGVKSGRYTALSVVGEGWREEINA
jgi:hypothetical protein